MKRRGAATVEFAVTLPLFLLLLLGTIEFGRMIQVQQKLTTASAVGARYASSGSSQVDLAANACFWGLEDPEAGLQWSNVIGTKRLHVVIEELDDRVTVSASVNFEEVAWMTPFWIDTMMTGRTTMFKEPGNVDD